MEMIRRLELQVKTLSKARSEDRIHIRESERELRNCYQEIEFLQDQLNGRDKEVSCLEELVQCLELKLADLENSQEEVCKLQKEITRSDSERLFLREELESREVELQQSTECIEKLEELISSAALESECEIESMRLDMMTLEQNCFEAKKFQEEAVQEKDRMNGIIQDFELQIQNAKNVIACLDRENKELKEKLLSSEMNATIFCQKVEAQFKKLLEKHDGSQFRTQSTFDDLVAKDSTIGKILSLLLSKIALVAEPDAEVKNKMKRMSHQIQEYEVLVMKLKEELREEKLKAKEEAEDLAQEMAELRFQITGMLEHECKRRACIEQASLQRIAELEAQIQNEQKKPFNTVRQLNEV